jgi:hypothetical protein
VSARLGSSLLELLGARKGSLSLVEGPSLAKGEACEVGPWMPRLAKETFRTLRVTTSPVTSSMSMTSLVWEQDIKESRAVWETAAGAGCGTRARGEDEVGDRNRGRHWGESARRLQVEEGEGDRREEYHGEGERQLLD